MELKRFQRSVLKDLSSYLDEYRTCDNAAHAYNAYLENGRLGASLERQSYHDTLGGVPRVCIKVPTGGGKTFIAASALSVIRNGLDKEMLPDQEEEKRPEVVVWLVPSKEILAQTLRRLQDPGDPLRRTINQDFGHRVEVLSKEDGLYGRGFNLASLAGRLTIFVLSYDSFKNKEGRRAYRENSALAPLTDHQRALGQASCPKDADDTALISAIAGTNPIVVVDESHHAKSELSVEMLRNMNPRFVLELTATPSKNANVISNVAALELKHEEMIKLPVIVCRRHDKDAVIKDAILLQHGLEELALKAEEQDGRYIRPIVLLQAESKGKEDSQTYERVETQLIRAGVHEDQIAIQTADRHDLDGVDLLDRGCQIRFIITIEALAEGWDCPFAYVLASVANKTSEVSVEQIVGRILRQPYAVRSSEASLNASYVLTSSSDFQATIDQVIGGLKFAGFSEEDAQEYGSDDAGGDNRLGTEGMESLSGPSEGPADENVSDGPDFEDGNDDGDQGADSLASNRTHGDEVSDLNETDPIGHILKAGAEGDDGYEEAWGSAHAKDDSHGINHGRASGMKAYPLNGAFAEQAAGLRIPQFVWYGAGNRSMERLELDNGPDDPPLLERDMLLEDFQLDKCGTDGLIFNSSPDEGARQVDVDEDSRIRQRRIDPDMLERLRTNLHAEDPEGKRKKISDDIYNYFYFNMHDYIERYGVEPLRKFIRTAIDQMDVKQLDTYYDMMDGYRKNIRDFIDAKADAYRRDELARRLDTGEIGVESRYRFPDFFNQTDPLTSLDRTLYDAEERKGLNGLEWGMAQTLADAENISWWHRIKDRRDGEFHINGNVNHYPDFIACTRKDVILAIETKGEQLGGSRETRNKLELGRKWDYQAGEGYRYFMVFESVVPEGMSGKGAYTMADFENNVLPKL